eukprot:scaffold228081_cov19-Tisochrysis_lutea.AAC.2
MPFATSCIATSYMVPLRLYAMDAARQFLEDFNDKMFYNMYGVENDEEARSKFLGEDYAGVFFATDAASRVSASACTGVIHNDVTNRGVFFATDASVICTCCTSNRHVPLPQTRLTGRVHQPAQLLQTRVTLQARCGGVVAHVRPRSYRSVFA